MHATHNATQARGSLGGAGVLRGTRRVDVLLQAPSATSQVSHRDRAHAGVRIEHPSERARLVSTRPPSRPPATSLPPSHSLYTNQTQQALTIMVPHDPPPPPCCPRCCRRFTRSCGLRYAARELGAKRMSPSHTIRLLPSSASRASSYPSLVRVCLPWHGVRLDLIVEGR